MRQAQDGDLVDDHSAWRVDRVYRLYRLRWSPERIAGQLGIPLRYVHRDLRAAKGETS